MYPIILKKEQIKLKNKHFVMISGVAAALGFVLRAVEYLLFIDAGGYYKKAESFSYVLYAVLFLVSAFTFVIMLSKTKDRAEQAIAGGKLIGILSVVCAIITALFSGWAAMSLSAAVPVLLHRALLLIGILAAVSLAVFGIGAISGKSSPLLRFIGFMPAVFVCLYGVCEFYQSFDRAQQSGTSYFMLSLCTLALYLTALLYTKVGAPVTLKRLTATAVLFPPFAAVWGGGYIVGCITGGAQFNIGHALFAVLQLIFVVCAFATLFRLDKKSAVEQPVTLDSELDTYINDIPTEETDE